MRFQRVGSRRYIQIILEHRFRRNSLRQLHVTAGVTETDYQRMSGLIPGDLLTSHKLVREWCIPEIEKWLDCVVRADDTVESFLIVSIDPYRCVHVHLIHQ